MQLDEARNLKRALLTGTVALDVGSGRESLDLTAEGAAIGIVPSDEPGSYRLAVRLTQEVPDQDAYVAAIRAVAGEDVDVRFVGPIRPLTESVSAVDTAVAQDVPTAVELQQRVRPLVRGASVAHRNVTAGTIGAFVRLADSDAIHILSNNHVLADSNRGEPGDDVLQPGPADGGSAADRVGELLLAVPLDPDVPNLVDAAVAVLDDEVEIDAEAHDGALAGVIEPAAAVGRVAKIGRTTGSTVGLITAFEVDGVQVGYDTGVVTFDDQVEIEGVDGAFSAGGDSGSVIYTETERQAVALLFAGSTTGGPNGSGVTYANSLPNVLSSLGATLI